MKTLKTLALVGALAAGSSAMANTITPELALFVPGSTITYNAKHSSGELWSGDGFTIYDVGGFSGVLSMPADWVTSASLTGSPYDSTAPFVPGDNTALWNVTFTYTGATVQHEVAFFYNGFVLKTGSPLLVVDRWASQDHELAPQGQPAGVVGNGPLGAEHTDTIQVPIPDGGATAMLIGLGILGLGALRRKA